VTVTRRPGATTNHRDLHRVDHSLGDLGGNRLGHFEHVADVAQHLKKGNAQGIADRGEQLRGRFLLATLDLGDVAQAHPRLCGDLSQSAPLPHPLGDELRRDGVAVPPFEGRPIQFVDVFPNTPDGKIHLCPASLVTEAPLGLYGYQPDPGSIEYPLALISPASDRTISSSLGELSRPAIALEMHPDDAEARSIDLDVLVEPEPGEAASEQVRPSQVRTPCTTATASSCPREKLLTSSCWPASRLATPSSSTAPS